ncbi:MAG: hypothetical protein COB66_06965 [Coxiella sp. (in: Bacteria)]|nr:MAG: hypothetical protein COB66_06965 [Coxiella sp. (in: g-proteobacteria)]
MRQKYNIIAALIIVLVLAIYWYEEHQQDKNFYKHHVVAVPVTVIKVKRQSVPNQVEAVGTLQAKRQVDIAPQIAGQVVDVTYTPGSFVKTGKVLIQLDDRIYRAKLKSAQSTLKLTKMDYQRVLQLARSGAASRQLLDQQRAAYQKAQAAVSTNTTYLTQASIKAPFDGYVGPKNVSIGDYVQKGEKLTTLTDRSQLRVRYQLSERYLPELRLGQKVKIVIPNQPDVMVVGKVTYIAPIINEQTHGVSMQATIPNTNNVLTPGLFVKVKQVTHVNRHALIVPQASIVPTITGPKIFIVTKNHARLVHVKTGPTFDNMIEVRKGLRDGERVVVAGQQRLQDGALVKEVAT